MIITDIRTSSLREIMGTYYVDLSVPIATSPTYTQPYIDFFINGEIVFIVKNLKDIVQTIWFICNIFFLINLTYLIANICIHDIHNGK